MNFLLREDINNIVKNTNKISNRLDGKKILITGGSGFLGKYFVEIFKEYNKKLKNPIKVTVYDKVFRNIDLFKSSNMLCFEIKLVLM